MCKERLLNASVYIWRRYDPARAVGAGEGGWGEQGVRSLGEAVLPDC